MRRFPNPSSNMDSFLRVFEALFGHYGDSGNFTYKQAAAVLTERNLVTAYGHAGAEASARSSGKEPSGDSIKMNMKMYIEIYRMLGWVVPAVKGKSYPVRISFLGQCAGQGRGAARRLVEECMLGLVYPFANSGKTSGNEESRLFLAILQFLSGLKDGVHRLELAFGPMSFDERAQTVEDLVEEALARRGSEVRFNDAISKCISDAKISQNTAKNYMRIPLSFMKDLGWIETGARSKQITGRPVSVIKITDYGEEILTRTEGMFDLRLKNFEELDDELQSAAVKVGMATLLSRAGFLLDKHVTSLDSEQALLFNVTEGRELLFSPYQTVDPELVDEVIGVKSAESRQHSEDVRLPKAGTSAPTEKFTMPTWQVELKSGRRNLGSRRTGHVELAREIERGFSHSIASGIPEEEIIDMFVNSHSRDNKNPFYGIVGALFEISGLRCRVSRDGDNAQRWDAILLDDEDSIPIEIKSPGEERYLSIKGVRQALENKAVLISRRTQPTKRDSTSMVVCFNLPTDRAEVSSLVNAFHETLNVRVSIMDFQTLVSIAVQSLVKRRGLDMQDLRDAKGIIDA